MISYDRIMDGLGSFAVLDQRKPHFEFALVLPFDVLNCKFHLSSSNRYCRTAPDACSLFLRFCLLRPGSFGVRSPALRAFLGFAAHDVITFRTGNGATNQQTVITL